MRNLKNIFVSILVAAAVSTGCATHNKNLVVQNFEASGSLCWDALVINQHTAGCMSHETEDRGVYSIQRCAVYKDDADPADPWLIHDFYIFRAPSQEVDVTIDTPVHPICVDTSLFIMYGPRLPHLPDVHAHPPE